jgi:hypothetical protein
MTRISTSLLAIVVTLLASVGVHTPWSNPVYESSLGDHDLFPLMATTDGDTPTFAEAKAGPEWQRWEEAMQKEIDGLIGGIRQVTRSMGCHFCL